MAETVRTHRNSNGSVAVLGTGAMGSAIARTVLTGRRSTTVWNRTPARGQALRDAGADIVYSPEHAVQAAEVVLLLKSLGPVTEFYGPDPGSAAAYFTARSIHRRSDHFEPMPH